MIEIPVEISARHVHLSDETWRALFGSAPMTAGVPISQRPQFRAVERVTLCGPKGELAGVGIVGPIRPYTQVELAATDARRLGITPPLAESGNLTDAVPVTIRGPVGEVTLPVAILQRRHIHAHPQEAKKYGLQHGQEVSVKISGPRGGVFEHVLVRVHEDFSWRLHLDTDEANAFFVTERTTGQVVST